MTKPTDEFKTISKYFAPLSAAESGAFNLTDDAAVIEPPEGQSLVVTTDALVAGVHFLPNDPPADIAAKLLRVSLSDLAAMGAKPAHYSLSLAVSSDLTEDWLSAFSAGLALDQKEFGVTLIGGDTVSAAGPLTLSLTAMGYVEKGKALRRSEAQIGDDIWVSGTIGDGALGLLIANEKMNDLAADKREYLLMRYRRPLPQLTLGQKLIGHARGTIDISDGLIADLGHICETSNVGANIQITAIPLSEAAKEALEMDPKILDLVLGGGDDYELLFTADASFETMSKSVVSEVGVALTKIGTITKGTAIRLFYENGSEHRIDQTGFTHF